MLPAALKRIGLFLGIFFIISFFLFSDNIIQGSNDSLFGEIKKIGEKYLAIHAKTKTNASPLKGEDDDRVNILLLGMGGKNHEGSDLTDTIILASYKPSQKKIALLSIPRDLLVYLPDYGWRKINHIYFFGEKEKSGQGGATASQFIGDLLDIPIHYYIAANFDGFKEAVDAIGGIEVEVENTLDDYTYPIAGRENLFPIKDRYEHLHIDKGLQKMDGSLALKFVRSRHALGIEGSDYARGRRQQTVLLAMKKKALSMGTLLNPGRLLAFWQVLKKNIRTNLEINEMYRGITLARQLYQKKEPEIATRILDATPEGPLIENIYDGAFVLETKTGNFEELQFIARYLFEDNIKFDKTKRRYTGATLIPVNLEAPPAEVTREEKATTLAQSRIAAIEIQNGTMISGLAAAYAERLRELGFNVAQLGNAQKQNYPRTKVYRAAREPNPSAEERLKELFSVETQTLPDTLTLATSAEYLVILGADTLY